MVGAHFCICAPWALIFDILNGGKWMAEMIRVAVDAMGGDNAPGEIIRGAAEALRRQSRLDVTLVGQEEVIRKELSALPDLPQERLHIHPASEVIAMAEPPVQAITKKKDSSIVQGMMLVRHGECDAFVTAGSSGATLVGGQLLIGRIKGIERAPFAPVLPTKRGPVLLIDCGANVDARASELVQWGKCACEGNNAADEGADGYPFHGQRRGTGYSVRRSGCRGLRCLYREHASQDV